MSIRRGIALALLAGLIALLVSAIASGPKTFHYLVLSPREEPQRQAQPAADEEGEDAEAPKEEKLSKLMEWIKALDKRLSDQATLHSSWGITSYDRKVSLSDDAGGSATAALQGLLGDTSLTGQDVLLFGRHLYAEEIQSGRRVTVLNEQLALSLFRVGDAVDRVLVLGGERYTVVGVTRHRRGVGDEEPGLIQVPLKALDKQGYQTTLLSVNLLPVSGAGAYAGLQKEMEQWQGGGTFYSLPKERYRALLPLRVLLCLAGLLLCLLGLKAARIHAVGHWRQVQQRMQTRYAMRMLPELVGRALWVLLLFGALLAGIALAMRELIAPVYMFPEWVPTILVEPKEITQAFWALRTQQTGLIALRTPAVLRLHFLHRMMTLACGLSGVLLLKPYHRLRDALQQHIAVR